MVRPACRFRTPRTAAVLAALALAAGTAQAWDIKPQITLRETITDNSSSDPGAKRRTDQVSEVSPRVRIIGGDDKNKLALDYQLRNVFYLHESQRSYAAHNLNANAHLQNAENTMGLDTRAAVSTEAQSLFSGLPVDVAGISDNRAERRSFQARPYVQGELGDWARWHAGYSGMVTTTDSPVFPRTSRQEWTARVDSTPAVGRLGWGAVVTDSRIDYSNRPDLDTRLAKLILRLRVSPDLRLTAWGGREEANYFLTPGSSAIHGVGFEYTPMERTRITGEREKRLFGDAYSFQLAHRSGMATWNLSSSRSLVDFPDQFVLLGRGDPLAVWFNALAGRYPDPLERLQAAEQMMLRLGSPTVLNGEVGFNTSRVFVQRRSHASVTLLGAANAVSLSMFRSDAEALDGNLTLGDDFDFSPRLRQSGWGLIWGREVPGRASLVARLMHTNYLSTQLQERRTVQDLLSVNYQLPVAPGAMGALGFRHVRTRFPASEQRENAVTAAINVQF